MMHNADRVVDFLKNTEMHLGKDPSCCSILILYLLPNFIACILQIFKEKTHQQSPHAFSMNTNTFFQGWNENIGDQNHVLKIRLSKRPKNTQKISQQSIDIDFQDVLEILDTGVIQGSIFAECTVFFTRFRFLEATKL